MLLPDIVVIDECSKVTRFDRKFKRKEILNLKLRFEHVIVKTRILRSSPIEDFEPSKDPNGK